MSKHKGMEVLFIKTVMNCLKRFEYHQFMSPITILALFFTFFIYALLFGYYNVYICYILKKMIQAYLNIVPVQNVSLFSLIIC